MTGDEPRVNWRQISFRNVQIGPAHATREHSQQQIAGLGFRTGNLLNLKEWFRCWSARDKDGGPHEVSSMPLDADGQATVPSRVFILGWEPKGARILEC
jgi:hypothetical protein